MLDVIAGSSATPSLIADANKISALRAAADGSGSNGHETPLTNNQGQYQVVAADPNTAIAFARTFAEVLRIHGYRILEASSAAAGLEIARQQLPEGPKYFKVLGSHQVKEGCGKP